MHKLFRLGEPVLPHLLEKLARNRHAGGFADDRVDAAMGAAGGIVRFAIPLGDLAGAKRLETIEAAAGLILLQFLSVGYAERMRANRVKFRFHKKSPFIDR